MILTGLLLCLNVTVSSTLPSGTNCIFSPIIFGPLSESFGRRICFLSPFGLYTVFTLACALAPTWPALLVFRFLVGLGASAPQAILGGMFSDVFPELIYRGRAITVFEMVSNAGPVVVQ